MKVKFYGVRGSVPVPGAGFQRYGGNTFCICVTREIAGRIVIIDAGTGIRNLGKELVNRKFKQEQINIVFTHFHWDHIQGFPFFAPAFNKEQKIGIMMMGKERKSKNLKEIFTQQMRTDYFPVAFEDMGAHFDFLNLEDKETLFGAVVTAVPQQHNVHGGSYGLRIEDESRVLVICTDIEHPGNIDDSIVELARDADLLIHDGQYTDEEYKNHIGWGHSTYRQAIEVAKRAKVKKLVITHHDPDHDDDFLDAMEKDCQHEFAESLFAREGMELQV